MSRAGVERLRWLIVFLYALAAAELGSGGMTAGDLAASLMLAAIALVGILLAGWINNAGRRE